MKTLSMIAMLVLAEGVAAAQEEPPADDEMQPVDPYDNGQQQYEPPANVDDDDVSPPQYEEGYDPEAYQEFEGSLSPYGAWEEDPTLGRVWVPSPTVVGPEFTPYWSGGHWTLTEYGWTWVSDWDWGWAPFHYGRWVSLNAFGWCWVPGTVWGPGWVAWRGGHGFVGWAPLPPSRVRVHDYRKMRGWWRYTAARDLGSPRMRHYSANVARGQTRPIRNNRSMAVSGSTVVYNAGPGANGRGPAVQVPGRLADVAPRSLPRYTVTPRVGGPSQRINVPSQRPVGPAARPGQRQFGPSRPINVPSQRPVAPSRPNVAPRSGSAPRSYIAPSERPYIAPQRSYGGPSQRPYVAPSQRPYVAPSQRPYVAPSQRPYVVPSQRPYAAPRASAPSGTYYAPRPAPVSRPVSVPASRPSPSYAPSGSGGAPSGAGRSYSAPAGGHGRPR